MPGMSTPRRHHLVPRFFLKRFAKSDKLVMIRRDDPQGKPHTTGTQNAAVESDFYKVTTTEGEQSMAIETYLSGVEADAGAAMQRLATPNGFPPSPHDRKGISRFLAFQTIRGQNARSWIQQQLAHGGRMGSLPGAPPQELSRERHLHLMLDMAEELAMVFMLKAWRIIWFQRVSLLTSDAPVAPASQQDGPAGIFNADWVLFPFDPLHALVFAQDGGAERPVTGTQETADYINQCVASQAHRWIYHRPNHSPLTRFTLPTREPNVISRVGEGDNYFSRPDAVEGMANSLVFTPFPLQRPAISDEVIAVLNGQQ
jgi:hypothetical protein